MRALIALVWMLVMPTGGLAKDGATTFEEKLTVRSLKLDPEKARFRLTFREKAAIYSASKRLLPCLERSLKSRQAVRVVYDPIALKVVECRSE